MSLPEFLSNVGLILAAMTVASLFEIVVPFVGPRPDEARRRRANVGLTAIGVIVNWALASIAAVAALSWRPEGLMARAGLPPWAQIGVGLVAIDCSVGYWSHRLLHEIPALWRVHRIHHSDVFVDVTTTYRSHPVETAWRFLFTIVPVWLLGVPAQAVVALRIVHVINGVLEHADVRLWRPADRALSTLWVTPNVHKVHHSRARAETNSNYGNVLCLYDRVFGTFTPSERAYGVVYGLDDEDGRAALGALLAQPFVPDTKVSDRAPAAG